MTASTDSSQRAPLLARLEAREAQLGAEVRSIQQELEETLSAAAPHAKVEDFGERGEHLVRAEIRHAERERDIGELRAIAAAKERIAQGRHGECADCGTDIPPARLEAQPSSARCLPGQQKFERAHPVGPRIVWSP